MRSKNDENTQRHPSQPLSEGPEGLAVSTPAATPAPLSQESHSSSPPPYPSGASSILSKDTAKAGPGALAKKGPLRLSSTSEARPPCRVYEVEDFLRTCKPSMGSFLNSFIAHGCHNRDFLAAIASWPEGEIADFLGKVILQDPEDQVAAERDGMPMTLTAMELYILQRHFKKYFAVSSKPN